MTGEQSLHNPRASRPHMPGYGILDATNGKGLLPWSWASERLVRARTYFVGTTCPDGAPHAMPVWGVWVDDSFYFSTGRQSRKARNLTANPKCVVSTRLEDDSIVVEGVAEEVADVSSISHVAEAYYAKYQWKLDPSLGPIFVTRPLVVFGLIETPGEFVGTATRWMFDH
jgi:nitroimidazol reductase NimA-like FMN-containing flavoprotein (pyridoxamine 5'-phosphate oxidase superfamily)